MPEEQNAAATKDDETKSKSTSCVHLSTVEPLTNDHPHQRPSLSYDHISCDGQWFLFVYESLTSDHPSYTTTPKEGFYFIDMSPEKVKSRCAMCQWIVVLVDCSQFVCRP